MQNQSNLNYELEYSQCYLSEDFPIGGAFYDTQAPSAEPVRSLHFHSCMEIGYCYSGAGLFFVNNKVIPFSKGDVSIIFKNEMHRAQSATNNLSEWTFIFLTPGQLLKELGQNSHMLVSQAAERSHGLVLKSSEHPEICHLVLLLISELKNMRSNYKNLVRSIVWSLMIFLRRITSEVHPQKTHALNKNMRKIMPAIEYISSNYMDEITLQDLAQKCYLSTSHFAKLFKSVTHASPSDYIKNIKIQMACLLLDNTEKSILEISESVGFNSLCNFNRSFKKLIGSSPSQWRKSAILKKNRIESSL